MSTSDLRSRTIEPRSSGLTLIEMIVVLVVVAVLATIGGRFISSDDLDFRLEAERVAEGIRWAQSYAISHACRINMVLLDNQYQIFGADFGNQPIDWPIIYSHCSENRCTLDSRVVFPAKIELVINDDGSFMMKSTAGDGRENLIFDSYYINIPIIQVNHENLDEMLWISVSSASGIIRVLTSDESSQF